MNVGIDNAGQNRSAFGINDLCSGENREICGVTDCRDFILRNYDDAILDRRCASSVNDRSILDDERVGWYGLEYGG